MGNGSYSSGATIPVYRSSFSIEKTAREHGDAAHLIVVVSDIEMGAGGVRDDFQQTEYLGDLLLAYNRPPYDEIAVTFVFNGDTFDLLKTDLSGIYPTRITPDVAVAKLERIFEAHSSFFDQLALLQQHRSATRRIVFVAGNHDLELLFPEVQARLEQRIGASASVEFAGHSFEVGDAVFEHGSQKDPLFAADADEPFIVIDGEKVLNIPWGTLALLEVVLPQFHSTMFALDRLRPRKIVLDRMPELRELLTQAYWRYWTREYWRGLLSPSDRLHRISWTMIKEVVYRLFTGDPELAGSSAQGLLSSGGPSRTHVLGHQHCAGYWNRDNRRVLQTGCFRNEYLLDADGRPHRLLPKVYAEVLLVGGQTVRAHLVEVDAPPPPKELIPGPIAEVLPEVRRQLQLQRR